MKPAQCLPSLLVIALFGGAATTQASGEMFRGSGLKPGEPYKGRMLSVDELDACLEVERTIRTLDSEIDQAELVQSLSNTRQRGLESVISAERQRLDLSDAGDVADFNAKVDELGREIDEYNARVQSNNDHILQRGAAVDRFNADCTHGYYDADMLKALSLRERRLAAQIEAKKQAPEKSH